MWDSARPGSGEIARRALTGVRAGSILLLHDGDGYDADGDYQGAVTIGMIIQSTTTNQVLTVQVARSAGTSAWKIDGNSAGTYVDRSGITIVKIPDGDFARLQSSTNFNLNPAAPSPWFSQRAFRQAISLAIDRDAIVKVVFNGKASPLASSVTPGNRLWLDFRFIPLHVQHDVFPALSDCQAVLHPGPSDPWSNWLEHRDPVPFGCQC